MSHYPYPIGRRIREARDAARLSLRQLQQACGIDFRRISEIERGDLEPEDDQLNRIATALGRSASSLIQGTDLLTVEERRRIEARSSTLRGSLRRDVRYPARPDVGFFGRLSRAREDFPEIVDWLDQQIDRRADAKTLRAFMSRLHCDSSEEALGLYHFAAGGGGPVVLATRDVGFRVHPTYDPRRKQEISDVRLPGLEARRGDEHWFALTQVPILAEGRAWRLDVLLTIVQGSAIEHAALEFDGRGHRDASDHRRDRSLRIPTLRFTTQDIVRRDFLDLVAYRRLQSQRARAS